MTTVETRRTGAPLHLLPVLLVVVLFGVALAMVPVSPVRATTGIYQVLVGDDEYPVVITAEALDCTRTADTATCSTPVGGQRLTVFIPYSGTAVEARPCTARHGDRVVPCGPQMGSYGHASYTVWVREDLGLSAGQLADLNAAAPWWRVGTERMTASLVLALALGAAAGVATFLLRRRARPVPFDRRVPYIVGTAVLGVALFAATGVLFGLGVADNGGSGLLLSPLVVLTPFSLFPAVLMAVWQWQLCGGPERGGRLASSVVAAAVVCGYTLIATFVFLFQSGFED